MNTQDLFSQKQFIFRCDGSERWYCTNFRTAISPADMAEMFGYSIPPYTQFLRIKDYDNGIGFTFRHNGGIIIIDLYSL